VRIKTPSFFTDKKSALSVFLLPLSLVYYVLFILTRKFRRVKFAFKNAKVICVGNVTVGGSGKTPICISIGELLKQNGKTIAYISKGYGRKTIGFYEVTDELDALVCGDEPKILSKTAKTFVYSTYKDLRQIQDIQVDYVIMDDGLQNNYIKKDIGILVFDGSFMIGNGRFLPSGPMRCRLEDVKYDLKIIVNPFKALQNGEISAFTKITSDYDLNDIECVLFSGIAQNNKFYRSVQDKFPKVKIVKFFQFSDHHNYKNEEIESIISCASGKKIFTTVKDFVKISPKYHFSVSPIEMNASFDEGGKKILLNLLILKR
jgi:tetraacyldisaccharide 4'-kinase